MGIDRKTFLRITGMSLAALAARKVTGGIAGPSASQVSSVPGALTARRWAMVVDARKCLKKEGCDLCIKACNRSHNVPEIGDRRHEVKWIWREPFKDAFVSEQSEYANATLRDKPFVVFCNHCDRPPCVRVCPTQATWKREDGIVMMDWHRCIGCRYCMAACPYGSRSFNWVDPRPYIKNLTADFPTRSKGVVEKCTFCAERLAQGKPPACVEACEPKALIFGDLEDPASDVRQILRSNFAIRRRAELGTAPEVYYVV
jgi:molybdopterin-containing oxidoreductase family iron-sulfur binding subunit